MKCNEQILIEEARKHAQKPEEINQNQLIKIPLQQIRLADTGIQYTGKAIRNRKILEEVCKGINAGECYEKYSVIAVNKKCEPLGIYSVLGTLDQVIPYPRVIATFALLSNAYGVFLTHNHPGGTCKPSYEDIESTRMIILVLEQLGIVVLDHLITTPDDNTYSMAKHGDLDFCMSEKLEGRELSQRTMN